jgi:hypothetical protein
MFGLLLEEAAGFGLPSLLHLGRLVKDIDIIPTFLSSLDNLHSCHHRFRRGRVAITAIIACIRNVIFTSH